MVLPISYNWKNLFVRKTTTVLTLLVIATVTGVFAWLLSFRGALSNSLSFASDDHKMIVLRKGSESETNSAVAPEDCNKLAQLNEEVALDPATRQPLQSREMIVQVSLPRMRDGGKTFANVAVRGVTDDAFKVHKNIRLLGESIHPGQMEVVVGLNASKQFGGLEVGKTINLGYSNNRGYKIVGYFSADGGPLESEIWGPLTSLMNSYQRTVYSSVSLRLSPAIDPKTVIAKIEGPAITLFAQTESQYWDSQAKNIRKYLMIVSILVGIMCLAAAFSIANTMFSSVAARTREFAMLRTIGFSGGQILTSIVIESMFLSVLGGLVGCGACLGWLELAGNTKDMFGASTFTTMAFEIHMTPMIVLNALGAVAIVGMLGALVPGLRAARIHVVAALREP